MTRAEKGLLPGENIVYRTKLHWVIYIAPLLLILFISLPCFYESIAYQYRYKYFIKYIFLIIALLPIGMFLVNYLVCLASEFVVTNMRVAIYLGVLSTKSFEIMLNKVESIGVGQEFSGRILGYGSIVVGGTGGSKERFANIQNPLEFRKMVEQQMEVGERK